MKAGIKKIIRWFIRPDLSTVEYHSSSMFALHSQVNNSCIGKMTSIGRYSKVTHADIGAYCSIAWDVTINAVAHDYKLLSTHSFSKRPDLCDSVDSDTRIYRKVIIGNDVWVGAHSIIMPGVKIGDGAVIGAGAIVTKDVYPYEIVVGNPAKHLRWRFDKDVIEGMKDVKWWEWEDEKIKKSIKLFQQEVTLELIKKAKSLND